MNTETDHDYFNCTYVGETLKSYFVKLIKSEATYSVPKRVCALRPSGGNRHTVLEVESWFANQEGMHGE